MNMISRERETGIDTWLDYLIKRWPVALALGFLIIGIVKTQFVQNAQAEDMKEIQDSIEAFSDIRAEWPYLKQKVDDVKLKLDNIDSKVDVLLGRA